MLSLVRESVIEKYLIRAVNDVGGFSRKISWVGRKSAPDRVIFLKGVWFVELKRPGAKARPDQLREHERLRLAGANIRVIDTIEKVDEFINEICPT